MAKSNGIVLYEGPSALDGAPVVVILTGLARRSKNTKTADMLQTWVLRQDTPPHEARRSGLDQTVCGDCPLASGNGCYVRVEQAPLGVWKAWRRGSYTPASGPASIAGLMAQHAAGRPVRVGSYGDPAAVPVWVWIAAVKHAPTRTGYTHQWRSRPELRPLCMASVHTIAEAREARAQGWRTFRTGPEGAEDGAEILCPAAGGLTTCDSCGLCEGATKQARSIWIPLHGSGAGKALLAIGG